MKYVLLIVALVSTVASAQSGNSAQQVENKKVEKIKVVVEFTLDSSGRVDSVWLKKKSKDIAVNNEAIRVIKSLPKWDMTNRRYKNTVYTQPITFILEDSTIADIQQ